MTTFDETYYRGIWGTVHRHDYCASLAESLIQDYGQIRILDIGTGCGYLVKCLRERGVDAWGLEVSDYAITNSCAPDYMRRGSVLDIPFASNRFDVVHSQGMFSHVAEADVIPAFAECQRVGEIQIHKIDTDEDCGNRHLFATVRPAEWWEDQFYPPVLVACPQHECKEYAFERWLGAIKSLTYPNVKVMLVDNSPTPLFSQRWGKVVDIIRPESCQSLEPFARIALSMEHIRHYFLSSNFRWWFNVESDVIVPPDAIERLLELGRGKFDWLCHKYPSRVTPGELTTGFGCSLFSRNIMRETFADCPAGQSADGWWWVHKILPKGYPTFEAWGALDIQHLAT